MEKFEILQGSWGIESNGTLKGTVVDENARCIAGTEDDTDYEVFATVKLVTGTAIGVYVFFTYGDAFEERFIRCVLDPINYKLTIEGGYNGAVAILASKTQTLALNTEYVVSVYAKTEEDGTTSVLFYLNGVIQLRVEDLAAMFASGLHGFFVEGTEATDYAVFSNVHVHKPEYYSDLATVLNQIRNIDKKDVVGKDGTQQDYYDYLTTLISQASQFVDGETDRENGFYQPNGITITEYADGAGFYAPPATNSLDTDWQEKAATLYLKQRPVLSITTIQQNSAAIGETDAWATLTKYRFHEHGQIMFATSEIPLQGYKNVKITYVAGYAKTPLDIQQCCQRLIVNYIHKLIGDRTAGFVQFNRGAALNFGSPDVFSSDIKAVLKRYRLVGYGEM